jgi:hypothetical protein
MFGVYKLTYLYTALYPTVVISNFSRLRVYGVYMNNLLKRDFTAFYPDFFWEKIPFAIQFIYIYIYVKTVCADWKELNSAEYALRPTGRLNGTPSFRQLILINS